MTPKQISDAVMLRRRKLNMTQNELAEKADLCRNTISCLENGEGIYLNSLWKICVVLGIELSLNTKETIGPE
jgi:DNA-binding XRE family transcriptional regulator